MISLLLCLALQDDVAAEVDKLQKDYQAAVSEYYKPYRDAKTEEDVKKIKLDPSKAPLKEYLPKFKDVAERAKGTDAGLSALLWIVQNGASEDKKIASEAVDTILTSHIESPKLEALASALGSGLWSLGAPKCEKTLRTLAEKSPHKQVQAAAKMRLAVQLQQSISGYGDEQKAEARKLFTEVEKGFADTRYAKEAKGYLYELEHLQVGMEAPDFDAKDLDGKAFKLSEYRGKVVVVDFWGFW